MDNWIPYLVAAVSTLISILLGTVAWFAKRELTQNSQETEKLREAVEKISNTCGRCPLDLKLWVQQNFVTREYFEKQEALIQRSVTGFESTLKQIDSNLAFLVKVGQQDERR